LHTVKQLRGHERLVPALVLLAAVLDEAEVVAVGEQAVELVE
jgi:hypothetical protein